LGTTYPDGYIALSKWFLTFLIDATLLPLKLWFSGDVLGSPSEGRGFEPCPMLDGNGVKAMPG